MVTGTVCCHPPKKLAYHAPLPRDDEREPLEEAANFSPRGSGSLPSQTRQNEGSDLHRQKVDEKGSVHTLPCVSSLCHMALASFIQQTLADTGEGAGKRNCSWLWIRKSLEGASSNASQRAYTALSTR